MNFLRNNGMVVLVTIGALFLFLLYFVPWSTFLIRSEGSLIPLGSWRIQVIDKSEAIGARMDAYANARHLKHSIDRIEVNDHLYAQFYDGSCDYHVEQFSNTSYELQLFKLAEDPRPCDAARIERDIRQVLSPAVLDRTRSAAPN